MDSIGDQLNIDTPELVSIEMPIAGIGSRFIAILVDSLIWAAAVVILIILAIILVASVHTMGRVSENWVLGIALLIFFLLQWGYFALFEAFNNGRTPGKHAARIHVIHRSGRAISFIEALARNLLRVIDYLPGFYAVGIVAIFLSRQNQRLGDMVAGTLVVRDRAIESPHWGELGSGAIAASTFAPTFSPNAAPHLSVQLPASHVARLSVGDLEVLEGFFSRRLDMDLATRAALAQRMASALCAKSGLAMPAGISVETFLEALAHQIREIGRL
ncbi:MAG TPA: RDD family protein [Terracidiphilus sp.]|nr:RDD family protein [Terracidiphilus sp.]